MFSGLLSRTVASSAAADLERARGSDWAHRHSYPDAIRTMNYGPVSTCVWSTVRKRKFIARIGHSKGHMGPHQLNDRPGSGLGLHCMSVGSMRRLFHLYL